MLQSWPGGDVRWGDHMLRDEPVLPPAPLLNSLGPRCQLVGHKSHNGPIRVEATLLLEGTNSQHWA